MLAGIWKEDYRRTIEGVRRVLLQEGKGRLGVQPVRLPLDHHQHIQTQSNKRSQRVRTWRAESDLDDGHAQLERYIDPQRVLTVERPARATSPFQIRPLLQYYRTHHPTAESSTPSGRGKGTDTVSEPSSLRMRRSMATKEVYLVSRL